jgi:murein DD-endopeptidase MepM/ murein hydrolase activator NlpD
MFNIILLIVTILLNACTNQIAANNNSTFKGTDFSFHPSHVEIKDGETLNSIATKYHVRLIDLLRVNNLKNNSKVKFGQTLSLPKNKFYVVKPGDSLFKIAKLFGTDLGVIAKTNKIKYPYKVQLNQQLIIPANKVSVKEIAALKKIDNETYQAVIVPQVITKNSHSSEAQLSPQTAPIQNIDEKAIQKPAVITPIKEIIPSNIEPQHTYVWPLKGKIIKRFGPIKNGLRNDGINISAPIGTPIKAIASGEVAYAGDELKSYGNLIIIKHVNDTLSAYAHLNELTVVKGEKIIQNQIIGQVGNSGNVETPQLHLAIRKGKKPVDPENYLPKLSNDRVKLIKIPTINNEKLSNKKLSKKVSKRASKSINP